MLKTNGVINLRQETLLPCLPIRVLLVLGIPHRGCPSCTLTSIGFHVDLDGLKCLADHGQFVLPCLTFMRHGVQEDPLADIKIAKAARCSMRSFSGTADSVSFAWLPETTGIRAFFWDEEPGSFSRFVS